jgi:putative heme-binding domain-containing protein
MRPIRCSGRVLLGAIGVLTLSWDVGFQDLAAQDSTQIAVETVRRLKGADLSNNANLRTAVERVVDQVRGKPEMVELIRDFDLRDRVPDLVSYLRQNPSEDAAVDAARYVSRVDPKALKKILADDGVPAALVSAIGRVGGEEIEVALEDVARSTNRPLPQREAAIGALMASESGAAQVLRLLEAKGLSGEPAARVIRELQKVRWPEIRAAAGRLVGSEVGRGADVGKFDKARIVQMAGDVRRGAEIFRRPGLACLTCHQVGREGADFGPRLGEIGGKLGKEALYDAIMDPSAGISFGYEAWLVGLKDGEEVLGLISSETDTELVLKVAGGQVLRYPKSEVLRRDKQVPSVMPAGLHEGLSAQDFADLLTYLAALKPVAP